MFNARFWIFTVVVILVILLISIFVVVSPNWRFLAVREGDNYQLYDMGDKWRSVLITQPEYTTPNDVKAGGFSPDSTKFAAIYHYGHKGDYSWYGVWSTQTGDFLYGRETPQFHWDIPSEIFSGQ